MRILESLLPKLFITLIPSNAGVLLSAELRKNATTIKHFEEATVQSVESLEKKIRKLERESAVTYIAFLETEATQGVLADCREREELEARSVERICVDNRWGLYIDKDDLFERQKAYKSIGLDLLFSPFSLLYNFYQETLQQSDGLYLLLGSDSISSCVYKKSDLLFGEHSRMQATFSAYEEINLLDIYVERIQSIVKAFYDSKADETMFIEKIYIADTLNFSADLENRLEAALFAEVEKRSVDLSHELILLCEEELK
ncbi:MAG: hypothetical protein MUP09_01680 [Thiovulaceae bacterium]|nr:hypothetical protein [Sulfurimonadaceae bacterium]